CWDKDNFFGLLKLVEAGECCLYLRQGLVVGGEQGDLFAVDGV
ncbi:MAG: hypothetical protein RL747_209, partial [Bacteroidota bacterium]